MTGIAEMFHDLSGYDRYEQALYDWTCWRIAQGIETKREWRSNPNNRRKDRARNRSWYARNREAVLEAQRTRSRAKRIARGLPVRQQRQHGTLTMYNSGRCRCDVCRQASSQARAARRARGGK